MTANGPPAFSAQHNIDRLQFSDFPCRTSSAAKRKFRSLLCHEPTCTTRPVSSTTLRISLPSSIVSVSGFSQYTSFPRPAGVDQHFSVPVVRRPNCDDVDVITSEKIAVVLMMWVYCRTTRAACSRTFRSTSQSAALSPCAGPFQRSPCLDRATRCNQYEGLSFLLLGRNEACVFAITLPLPPSTPTKMKTHICQRNYTPQT